MDVSMMDVLIKSNLFLKVKGKSYSRMALFIKEDGKMDLCMEKEFMNGKITQNIRVAI
jgi:hypothetical protein